MTKAWSPAGQLNPCHAFSGHEPDGCELHASTGPSPLANVLRYWASYLLSSSMMGLFLRREISCDAVVPVRDLCFIFYPVLNFSASVIDASLPVLQVFRSTILWNQRGAQPQILCY